MADDDPLPKPGQQVNPPAHVTVPAEIEALRQAGMKGAMGLTGISDAISAMRGEMTPEEQQAMAIMAVLGIVPGAKAEEAAVQAGTKAIRAFHGSPYDFERFSMAHIGTGEGAQAYGHGLYFAENPDVAGQYRQSLSYGSDFAGPIKRAFPDMPGGVANRIDQELNMLRANGLGLRNENNAITALYARNAELRGWITKGGDKLRDIIADRFNSAPGKTYEVNINADPEHFLDWDKKVRDMPQPVQDKLASLGIDINGPDQGLLGSQIINKRGVLTGDSLDNLGLDFAGVSQKLRQAGIPGIKYLDQGSRGAGKNPTYNYVVFDDKLIDIIKKYGIAGLIGANASNWSPKND